MTPEDIIQEFGEPPICGCEECQKIEKKVNINLDCYRYYKKLGGYPKFISGHNSKGKNNPMFGKHHTEESINKNRNSNIGKQSGSKNPIYGKIGKNSPTFGKHWKRSKEANEKLSKTRVEKGVCKGKKNPNFGKLPSPKSCSGKGCYYESPLQGTIWLRSSYEFAYAQYLDSIEEIWFYEPNALEMVINGKETTYTPDFSIPIKRVFIEIKGYMSPVAKLKSDKFKEEIDNEELMGIFGYKILFKEDLQKLGIKI